jgi:hypothetical protein
MIGDDSSIKIKQQEGQGQQHGVTARARAMTRATERSGSSGGGIAAGSNPAVAFYFHRR